MENKKKMDILEFEIRYRSYTGMNEKFDLWWTDQEILELCKITDGGILEKKINETDPNMLKELTVLTYTDHKKQIISSSYDKTIVKSNSGEFSVWDYIERTEYELKVIKEMGFNSYLLVVQDFINRSKSNGIPVWPGRWSAAGSLVCWLIGITDVDPIRFGLIFERFLNPARVSMPDIDTDFDDEQRDKVFEYIRNHYGQEHVSKIGTFMNMSAKAAFKDVARVFGIPFDQSNRIVNLFTIQNDDRTINFQRCWDEIEELKNMLENDSHMQKIVEVTSKLIWTYRQTGIHACGILIAPDTLTDHTSLQIAPNANYSPNERYVSQYDNSVAKIEDNVWLIKMDFLGLSNLSIIRHTIKIIIARHKTRWEKVPEIFEDYLSNSKFEPDLEDKNVYENIFQKWNTTGIFQFESDGMKRFLIPLKPDSIDDIAAMNALYRPWPIEFIPSFINRKHGKEPIEYMIPELKNLIIKNYDQNTVIEEEKKLEEDLKPILEVTYGVAVFQEQLMAMSEQVAWFSLAEADELRRAVWKKIVEKVKKIKWEFVEKAIAHRGYKSETATWVFEKMIEPAALYSFNKSHSVAYWLVAYQTAYLKYYYPVEFHAALLRANETNTDELSKFINEIKLQWLKILPPDINKSYTHVSAVDDYIILGFLSIKWVWEEVWETIERIRREWWDYKDLSDFLTRCRSVVNKKSLEWLAKSWALDNFNDRWVILENMDMLLEWTKNSDQVWWGWLFGGGFVSNTLDLKSNKITSKMDKIKLEYEVFKTFISAHPFDGMFDWIKSKWYNLIMQMKAYDPEKNNGNDFGPFNILGMVTKVQRARKKGYFIKIEDISDYIEFFVKDPLDLKEFDLVSINGYKWKWTPRLKKIIKIGYDQLESIVKATWKWSDEDVFEVKVKKLGIKTTIPNEPKKDNDNDGNSYEELWLEDGGGIQNIDNSEIQAEDIIHKLEESNVIIWENNKDEYNIANTENIIWEEVNIIKNMWDSYISYKFDIPSDMKQIQSIQHIIKEHPWELEILLGNMKLHIDENWLKKIKEILIWK